MKKRTANNSNNLSQLEIGDLKVLQAIAEQKQPVTSDFLDDIVPYQGPAKNNLLRKLCNLPNPNEANFPFLIRERRGENGKFVYSLNPQVKLNSIRSTINKKMGLEENNQAVNQNSQTQLILEKLEEIKKLVEADMA